MTTRQGGELELLVAGIVAGQSDEAIASSLGVSVRTLYRRKGLEETQQLIVEARLDAARQLREGVVDGALMAVRRLHQIVGDEGSSDTAAVNAAKYLVALAIGPGGLPSLVEPLSPGSTCDMCGHHHPAPIERLAAREELDRTLDAMRERLLAPPPTSADSTGVPPTLTSEKE